MKILLRIPEEALPLPDCENFSRQAAAVLFNTVSEQYNEQVHDPDVYLYDYGDRSDMDKALNMIYGPDSPDKIKETAASWNQEIMDEFSRALKALADATPKTEAGALDWLRAPSPVIYDMKKAAMALDGDFYEYARQALLISKKGYFTTFLTDAQLEHILTHPEEYAVINVIPN